MRGARRRRAACARAAIPFAWSPARPAPRYRMRAICCPAARPMPSHAEKGRQPPLKDGCRISSCPKVFLSQKQ
ncbi:hypothetical protein RHECNPAF_280011 [Rhizobium etli CNPAF512]|nr:hypothetical protein RHECNPAF_280011 [Rhizobium etli CNPAF512]